jgi:short-subunit dehydrogenase
MSFVERYGPWAAVTGAGQGIGAAFAADLVARGVSVVLVDRDEGLLAARATELGDAAGSGSGVSVRTAVVDLAAADGAQQVLAAVDGLELGLLVNNAALSFEGSFLEQSLADGLTQIQVNCIVPLTLVHALLPPMVARGRGGIILLSSLSAMRGAPLVSGYAATKAWNLILAESVSEELRGTGVDVMALLPGSTRTPGWLGSRPQASLGTSNVMDPPDVAREALDALGTVPSIIAGQENRESEAFMESLDRAEAIKIMGDVMRQMYPPTRDADPTI